MAGPSFSPKKDDSTEGVFLLEDIPHHIEQDSTTDLVDLSPPARFAVEAERCRDPRDQLPQGTGRQEERLGDYRRRGEPRRDRSASPIVPAYRADENSIFVPERDPSDLPTRTTVLSSSRGSSGTRNAPRKRRNTPQTNAGHENGRCTCPISYDCRRRPDNKLDCRPLVHTFLQWNESMDQEAYKRQIANGYNPAGKVVAAQRLTRAIQLLDRVETIAVDAGQPRKTAFEDLREWILKMHVCNVTEQGLTASQILPRIRAFIAPENKQARESKKIPVWYCEEMTVLYRKWHRGNYSSDPKRGLNKTEVLDKNNYVKSVRYTLNKDWAHYVDARYFGEHLEEDKRLVNGQVYYSRAELMRDGVHAPLQAGIGGTPALGAYSVVMGHHSETNAYADIDMGDVIEYEGTGNGAVSDEDSNEVDTDADNQPGKLTSGTKALMKSYETGTPIRVIRSFNLAKIVTNKPTTGYRYDGLYRVTRKTLQKERGGIWSFRMERIEGQGRLRGFGYSTPTRPSNGARKGKKTLSNGLSR